MLQKEDVPVIIQADAAAPSGLLVRIIDEAKLGGATKVSLAARRPQS
jgi:biopolymer transport protein ExbD